METLEILQREIVACELCPRLVEYRQAVARIKRRAYRDETYWGRPVPSFGDVNARLLIVGLAPGAHGANRTGRMFTGDSSGHFLYRTLFETGFASQANSTRRGDGLLLTDAYISAAVHCAPPDNKPSTDEVRTCSQYLARELALLRNVRVVVALGRLAFDTYLKMERNRVAIGPRSRFEFGHERVHHLGPGCPHLIASYHPSQQNTSTGKLTPAMFRAVFEHARELICESE